MDILEDNPKCVCIFISTLALIALVIAALVFSASTVEPIQYGLKYNQISKQYDTDYVYTGGWYIIGPLSSFIVFPSTNVNIDFATFQGATSPPLASRAGSLAIELSFSFQYQLERETIPDLYKMYSTRYETTFVSIAMDIIQNTSYSLDSVYEYWQNRDGVTQKMFKALDDSLKENFARCTGFQILNVVMSQTQEDSIVNTQVQTQLGQQKMYEQEVVNITSATNVDNSNANVTITNINSKASAEATTIKNNADAYAKNLTITTQAIAYNEVASLTSQTPADTLNDYIYYTNLLAKTNTTMLVGINSALINSGKGYSF